jgi:hypothetical protein
MAQRRLELKYSVRYKCKSVGKSLISRRFQWKISYFPALLLVKLQGVHLGGYSQPSTSSTYTYESRRIALRSGEQQFLQKPRNHLKTPDARQVTYFKPTKIRRHCRTCSLPHRCVYCSLSKESRS